MLRKATLVLALIGASVLFLTPSTASAKTHRHAVVGANCTPRTTHVTYSGYWDWWAQLTNCTAVNGVEFAYVGDPIHSVYSYMVDRRNGSVHYPAGGGGQIIGVYDVYQTRYQNIVWDGGHCAQYSFLVYKVIGYRLRNANGSTWGSWHTQNFSPDEYIC